MSQICHKSHVCLCVVRFLLVANKIQWKIGAIRKGSCAVNAFAFSYQYIDLYTDVYERETSNQSISIHWFKYKCVRERKSCSLSWFLNRSTNLYQYLAKISLICHYNKGDQWRFQSRFHWTWMAFRICHYKIIIWKDKKGDQRTFHRTRMASLMIH